MLGDLASDGTIQLIKNASLSLDAEGEEVRWDVTVRIELDFIAKSIRDSPRPSKTQGVPPSARRLRACHRWHALTLLIELGVFPPQLSKHTEE